MVFFLFFFFCSRGSPGRVEGEGESQIGRKDSSGPGQRDISRISWRAADTCSRHGFIGIR